MLSISHIGFHKPVLTVYKPPGFPVPLWENFCTTIQIISEGKVYFKNT